MDVPDFETDAPMPDEVNKQYGACALDTTEDGAILLPTDKSDNDGKKGDEEEAKWAADAKETFKRYDEDGDGCLSKKELSNLLGVISSDFSDQDVDVLLKEADTNKDGRIQFDEFVDWLIQPAAQSLGRAVIGYAECFKCMFDVYDKDMTGLITPENFEECHVVLQAAMRMNPVDDDEYHRADPLSLEEDHKEVFSIVDKTGDGMISFLEFVDWMREHIPKDMDTSELKDFCNGLAQMLKSTFEHMTLAEEGYIKESEAHVLEEVVKKLAQSTQKLSEGLKVKKKDGDFGKPQWSEPPVGMSVDRLKATHMGVVPLNMKRVKDVCWEVLCLPMPGDYDDPDARIWLAEVVRRVTYKTGRDSIEQPEYYVYDRKNFSWGTVCDSQNHKFQSILEKLSPGIGVFCLLKTAANFGIKILWTQIQNALQGAVDMKFLREVQLEKFNEYIEEMALENLDAEGIIDHETSHATQLKAVEEWLAGSFSARPRMIMAILSELNMVEVDPAWEDYIGGEL